MDILVLAKRVPETGEADLDVDGTGRAVRTDDLSFGTNEWDDYAVEEAVRLKEELGGTVTVSTVGDEEAEEVLRRALAMGADAALHVTGDGLQDLDPRGIARALAAAVEGRSFDLVLCGAVSSDHGHGQTGGLLAGFLGLPYVALATDIDVKDGAATVRHEVEGGLERLVEVDLPAVVSVQTGINEPRYVSIRGIRKVSGVEIPTRELSELGLEEDALRAQLVLEGLEAPPARGTAEMLDGDPEAIADALVQKLRERGGL